MLLVAAGAAIGANPGPPPVARSTTKPVSVVALSRHVRLTCGPACSVACQLGRRRWDGRVGRAGERRRVRLRVAGRVVGGHPVEVPGARPGARVGVLGDVGERRADLAVRPGAAVGIDRRALDAVADLAVRAPPRVAEGVRLGRAVGPGELHPARRAGVGHHRLVRQRPRHVDGDRPHHVHLLVAEDVAVDDVLPPEVRRRSLTIAVVIGLPLVSVLLKPASTRVSITRRRSASSG